MSAPGDALDALPPGLRTFAEGVARALLRGAEVTVRMPPLPWHPNVWMGVSVENRRFVDRD